MKSSKYNFFTPYSNDDSKMIAYNARSNALSLMDIEKYDVFMKFCNENVLIDDEVLVSDLKKGAFIVDDEINELDLIRYSMLQNRFNTRNLTIVIAPTLDCNFRCVYCYEKDSIKPVYISEGIQDSIVALVEKQAKSLANLSVVWYGGEPLMAFDAIERLSNKMIKICNENDVSYSASIVTNGYLLKREIVEKFISLHINFIQITIDGTPDIHDMRRPLAGGHPTFSTIMNNIKDVIDITPVIALRINVDKDNVESCSEVTKYIKEHGLDSKVIPYLGRVTNDNGCFSASKCLSIKEYSEYDYSFTLSESEVNKNKVIMNKYPQLRSNFCGADSFNSFVFGPEGSIYKCWCDLGIAENSVGNVQESLNSLTSRLLDYMLFDPTADKICSNCNILPLCMGGCPYQRINNNIDNCSIYKHMLKEYIEVCAKTVKESKEMEKNKAADESASCMPS